MFTHIGPASKSDLSCCGMCLKLIRLDGGCGGIGDIYGFLVCKKKYMQTSGGLVPTKLQLQELGAKMTEEELKAASKPIF